jgi:mannan endo-1,4-beta-mannosidase
MAVTVTHVVNGPANPNASSDCFDVLRWLTCLCVHDDTRVVSGQHICCGWDLPAAYATYITALYNETGKYPALLGADLAYGNWSAEGQNSTLIDYWDNGGLIMLSWHAYNPWTGNGLEWTGGTANDTSMNGGDFSDLYTSGDAYDMWHADMEKKADWLDELQDAGVVVLWRPFHEMNGGWFWWGQRDQTKFINNWIEMFDYFTYERELNNLLWVYAPNSDQDDIYTTAEYYYPGAGYVDIVGLDYYLTGSYDIDEIGDCGWPELKVFGKPMALTEFGPTGWYTGCGPPQHPPAIDCYEYDQLIIKAKTFCPEICFFQVWEGNYAMINQAKAQELLDDSWTITRDEVDW